MKKVNLIDVRTAFEYSQGSVPNAINVPLNDIAKRIDELKLLQPLIIFCAAGIRSQKAIDFLKANGINNIENGGGLVDIKARLNVLKNIKSKSF